MITTTIAVVYGIPFFVFYSLVLWNLVKLLRAKEGEEREKILPKLAFFDKLGLLMLPLYFLTELIHDVFFVYQANLGDVRMSLLGFLITTGIFLAVLFRSRGKTKGVAAIKPRE